MQEKFRLRMCVVCKEKFSQNALNRYCNENFDIFRWKNRGRSFYICNECLKKDAKILHKCLRNFIKGIEKFSQMQLKEKLING